MLLLLLLWPTWYLVQPTSSSCVPQQRHLVDRALLVIESYQRSRHNHEVYQWRALWTSNNTTNRYSRPRISRSIQTEPSSRKSLWRGRFGRERKSQAVGRTETSPQDPQTSSLRDRRALRRRVISRSRARGQARRSSRNSAAERAIETAFLPPRDRGGKTKK